MDGFAQAQKGMMMNDLISRQMLLEYIHGEPVGRLLCDKYNLDGLIEQLPSAQPEIIRCKDCKYNTYSKKCLQPDSFFLVPADDFYCGYAERKTDD